MTDYAALIDAETWTFIERTNAFYPPETVGFTIPEQRAVYDRLCRAFFAGYPPGVVAETTEFRAGNHAVPVRIYQMAAPEAVEPHSAGSHRGSDRRLPLVLYFHGGGFILGGLDSHDDICAELCSRTGFPVASIDYRLAPEHRHPAAYDDALAAYAWARETFGAPILLCGDSAGGNLAAAVAHATRGAGQAIGQVLIYPGLGGDRSMPSYIAHANAPMLTLRDIVFYRDIRAHSRGADPDPTAEPLKAADFAGLPPTVIITAQCDPLSSDGEVYRDRILAAGGQAYWREEPGLVHGYLRARHTVGRARESFGRIVEAVSVLGRGEWADSFPSPRPRGEGGPKGRTRGV